MRGRHARPSPVTGAADKAVPVMAAVGTLLTVQHPVPRPQTVAATQAARTGHTAPEARRVAVAEVIRAYLDSATKSSTYTVQPGDCLYSIAEHFYHDADWTRIWDANKASVPSPALIFPGQRLVIPGAGTTVSGTSSASAVSPGKDAVPAQPQSSPASSVAGVPATASQYIQQAARSTGLPVAVVAAQNNVESSYGQNMGPSSAGAMGPWQFMPGTWSLYSSAPFSEATSWATSTPAYITMMRQLLQWSGGNVRQALAAYNAGQGNWQAGLGYADQILSQS